MKAVNWLPPTTVPTGIMKYRRGPKFVMLWRKTNARTKIFSVYVAFGYAYRDEGDNKRVYAEGWQNYSIPAIGTGEKGEELLGWKHIMTEKSELDEYQVEGTINMLERPDVTITRYADNPPRDKSGPEDAICPSCLSWGRLRIIEVGAAYRRTMSAKCHVCKG